MHFLSLPDMPKSALIYVSTAGYENLGVSRLVRQGSFEYLMVEKRTVRKVERCHEPWKSSMISTSEMTSL